MSADTLTLDVSDRPTISPGDSLHVTPDVGRAYRARVLDVRDDGVRVRLPPAPDAPVPTGPQKRTWSAEELAEFYVTGDLRINPAG